MITEYSVYACRVYSVVKLINLVSNKTEHENILNVKERNAKTFKYLFRTKLHMFCSNSLSAVTFKISQNFLTTFSRFY